MFQIIRKGDKTTHGGSVLTASATMKFGGIDVARKGDNVSCQVPGQGPTTIVEGNPDYLDYSGPKLIPQRSREAGFQVPV